MQLRLDGLQVQATGQFHPDRVRRQLGGTQQLAQLRNGHLHHHLGRLDAVGGEQQLACPHLLMQLDLDLVHADVIGGGEAGVGQVLPRPRKRGLRAVPTGAQVIELTRDQPQPVVQRLHGLALRQRGPGLFVTPGLRQGAGPGQPLDPVQFLFGQFQPLAFQRQQVRGVFLFLLQLADLGFDPGQLRLGRGDGQLEAGGIDLQQPGAGLDEVAAFQFRVTVDDPSADSGHGAPAARRCDAAEAARLDPVGQCLGLDHPHCAQCIVTGLLRRRRFQVHHQDDEGDANDQRTGCRQDPFQPD